MSHTPRVAHPNALHIVTGGTGTIGRCVVQALATQSVPYIVTSRRRGANTIQLDLTSAESIRRAAGQMRRASNGQNIVLVHLAGGVTTNQIGDTWDTAPVFIANGLGPIALIDQLSRHRRLERIVVASSIGVRQAASTRRITSTNRPTNVLQQYTTGKLVVDAYLQRIQPTRFLSVGLGATKGEFFEGEPRFEKLIMRAAAGRKVSAEHSAGAVLWALQPQANANGLVVVSNRGATPYRLDQLPDRAYDSEFQAWTMDQYARFMSR